MNFPTIPAFSEKDYFDEVTSSRSRVVTLKDATDADFDRYAAYFVECGFLEAELRESERHLYGSYLGKGGGCIFMNYFTATGELSIVCERECNYFSFDAASEGKLAPQITQIRLEDYGMSYAIRLSDGRYIVIDGGREFDPDADRLYECIKHGSPTEKPTIAAWIMTHPHSDHFHCFEVFIDKYADRVVLERMMFNFPEHDDTAHYPTLKNSDRRFERDVSAMANIPLMLERIERMGAEIYTPHTGQIYEIGDAVCEILACMDDTVHISQNVNATSLVIRMTLGSQVILWTADAAFSTARLPEKYGDYLKADILQIPHHAFISGTAEAEIAGYDLIRPRVCLLPVAEFNAYLMMCTYKKSARYIFTRAGVEQIISGDTEKTLTLPYTPPTYAKDELRRKVEDGINASGATCWIFTDLSTANEEDMHFSILNTTASKPCVTVEMYFADSSQYLRGMKTEVAPYSVRRVKLADPECFDNDYLYFEWRTVGKLGIPEDAPFAVRFMSDTPIVVSHKTRSAAHTSSKTAI